MNKQLLAKINRALEAIYKAFHGHGIEIPFPRRAVYIKTVPEKE